MKKFLPFICILLFSGMAFADSDTIFTPLNFNDGARSNMPVADSVPTSEVTDAVNVDAVGNGNIQNAILQLDNAQVDIRTELQNYRAKYSDVDAQFKLVKAERSALNKQIKSVEKRIKNIEKAKDKIRKNML